MLSQKRFMILMVTIIVLLSACSTNNDEEIQEDAKDLNNNEEIPEEISEEILKEIPVSVALDKEKIWLEAKIRDTDKLEKETIIYNIYVFENGEFTLYYTGGLKAGDLVNLSDDEIIEIAIKRHNEEVEEWPSHEKYTDQAYDLGFLLGADDYEIRGMKIYEDDGMDRSYSMGDNLVLTLTGGIFDSTIEDQYFEGFYLSNGDAFITRIDEKSLGLFKYDDPDADKESVKFQD